MDHQSTEQIFKTLLAQPDNQNCFECGTSSPLWASVNNGIYLCLNCSGLHRGFGVSVSFVRSITMDSWNERQISFMKMAGNKKLKDFFFQYNISSNSPIDFKYKTKAGQYYRDMLKALVEGIEIPEPPSLEEGLELLDYRNPNFSSFLNSYLDPTPQTGKIYGSNVNEGNVENEDFIEKSKKVIGGVLTTTAVYSKKAYENVSTKVKDPEFQNEVKEFGTQVKEKSIEAGKVGFSYAKKGFSFMKDGMFKAIEMVKEQQAKKKDGKVEYQEYFANPNPAENHQNPASKNEYPDLNSK